MKSADWTRAFWTKAGSFLLATLLVPFGLLCGGSLAAAYGFGWWTGGNENYRDFLLWAQDRYWTQRGAEFLYGLHFAAIPLLAASILLLLFLVIYLARAAGWQPGEDAPRAGWQEKIPFDVYLAFIALFGLGLAAFASEVIHQLDDEPFLFFSLLLSVAALGAALLLGTWMTLCTRVKLGGWWHGTATYRLFALAWRVLKWCGRVLRAAWQGIAALVRGVPLIWRTVLGAGVFSMLVFLLAAERAWGLLFLLLAAFCLCACAVSLQLRTLQRAGEALAAGELEAKLDTKRLFWDFRRHGDNLNDISGGIRLAVERQLKSERLKTELITNVSHDIKTPLTSIINYVDLLRRDPKGEHAAEYLDVLDRQSKRLKKLTEDLVEMSKASTGNLPVNLSRRSVNELLSQALGEYGERLEKAQLEAVLTLPEQEAFVWADGTLLWRVLDNVLSNACKYALPGTRFYADVAEDGGRVRLTFKNVSRDRLNIPAEELMERFVRGDSARGGEGSGLGLNIARTLTELQGGTFGLNVDGDLFRVDITLPSMPAPQAMTA
ncbi:MAG: HAMP domain-containing histidine kinase [Ruminococcaceae bacterium]|jgi:signal transduction histidine kinase|nr:HAMP domain-containing histidine kinase [Oscillospiraceae bacterium]